MSHPRNGGYLVKLTRRHQQSWPVDFVRRMSIRLIFFGVHVDNNSPQHRVFPFYVQCTHPVEVRTLQVTHTTFSVFTFPLNNSKSFFVKFHTRLGALPLNRLHTRPTVVVTLVDLYSDRSYSDRPIIYSKLVFKTFPSF